MTNTTLGYHTFTIFLKLTIAEAKTLYSAFCSYDGVTIIPSKLNEAPPTQGFFKSYYKYLPKHYTIVYPNRNKGIRWNLRLSYQSPGFIHSYDSFDRRNSHQEEDKPCSIKATINPKLFTGINDYVAAATESHLHAVDSHFNQEAEKISPLLGTFSSYSLNRVDYCINFDLKELGINCPPDKMMKLIERADIPTHYTQFTSFSESSRRNVPQKNSFYLMNNSVNINTYWKLPQLHKEFSDCPQIDDALNVIRFEIQCKYPKVYNMSRVIKNNMDVSKQDELSKMLSDESANAVIYNYFYKVLRMGNYYTLDFARKIIKRKEFHINKEDRLIRDLTLINHCRGIAKAKSMLKEDEREDFRRSIRELENLNINPVTIPKEWNIRCIPNLLFEYERKISTKQYHVEALQDYYFTKSIRQ